MNRKWRCLECRQVISSGALLKICPSCGRMGTLVKEEERNPKHAPGARAGSSIKVKRK